MVDQRGSIKGHSTIGQRSLDDRPKVIHPMFNHTELSEVK